MWPAKQAPFYKYGWQSALALLVLVGIMTCVLRFIDLRYLMPKRDAFAAVLHGEDVDVGAGAAKAVDEESDLDKKGLDSRTTVQAASMST